MLPPVGSAIRLRIFSSVLLPAPLRPMIPTTSPGWTSNETPLNAQNVSASDALTSPVSRNRRNGDVIASVTASRNELARCDCAAPRRYDLLRSSTTIAGRLMVGRRGRWDRRSDQVGESTLGPAEVGEPEDEQGQRRDRRDRQRDGVPGRPQDRRPAGVDQAEHRIQRQDRVVAGWAGVPSGKITGLRYIMICIANATT